MAVFTKKTTEAGQVQYRKDGKLVKLEDIDEMIRAKLEASPEGTPVPEDDQIDPSKVPLAKIEEGAKKVKIHLEHTLCVNGVAYLGGTRIVGEGDDAEEEDIEIEVPEEIAEDLKRIDRANSRYEKNLLRGQDLSRKSAGVRVESINAADA